MKKRTYFLLGAFPPGQEHIYFEMWPNYFVPSNRVLEFLEIGDVIGMMDQIKAQEMGID